MSRFGPLLAVAAAIPAVSAGVACAQSAAPAPLSLTAETLRVYDAPDADQGAAVDAAHVYAVDNYVIAKIDRKSGETVARWALDEGAAIAHLNSCYAEDGRLWCANSNYPQTPMASSIEVFTTQPLAHDDSHSLGIMEEGSLTWFAPVAGGWIAGFAHYDERGGLAYKDHSFAGVVAFDADWRRTGGWTLPESVIARMSPYAASGGAIGPDGLLYVMGHDLPEMYVLARPVMGPALVHIATIAVDAPGQAFSWDREAWSEQGERIVTAIDRGAGEILSLAVPEIPLHNPNARAFLP